jgi:hypothetical protein
MQRVGMTLIEMGIVLSFSLIKNPSRPQYWQDVRVFELTRQQSFSKDNVLSEDVSSGNDSKRPIF